MSALPGYDYWKTNDFEGEDRQARYEAKRDELMGDSDRLAELDEARSQILDGDAYTEMFVVLADMSQTGALDRIAEGDAHLLNAAQLDTFAKLARLADRMAAEREAAIEQELES